MTDPLLISTWSFSLPIIEKEFSNLLRPNSALDVVESCAIKAEEDESIDSVGYGGLPDRDGRCTFDAAVMTSPNNSGAVCGIERHLHPTSIARAVMEKTPHNIIAGELADQFADECGFPTGSLLSPKAKLKWKNWLNDKENKPPPSPIDTGSGTLFGSHDTVGTIALDVSGNMAASCTTSGMAWKVPGRVGDSPIIGHGLYVDPQRGAATGTGHGELISNICGSFLIVDLMGRGATPEEAIFETIERLIECCELKKHHQAAFIAISPEGNHGSGALRPGFKYSICNSKNQEILDPDFIYFK